VNWLRVFFVGGLTSYRALFRWLNPWVYVPIMLVYPIFQILFFAYLGRGAGLESDTFFLIGNAVSVTAVACLFGMGQVIGNERWFQTLPVLLSSPASRLALFLGRSLPTMLNAIFVSAFSLAVGAIVLGVTIPASAVEGLAFAILACSFSCTGLGLCFGALGLRGRNVLIFANLVDGLILVICGVNVPLQELPGWVQTISRGLPLTHGIEAARRVVAGASAGAVAHLLVVEVLIGIVYLLAGIALLRLFELEGRRTASLETF
jgi:ABC-2 type transport system permease protein